MGRRVVCTSPSSQMRLMTPSDLHHRQPVRPAAGAHQGAGLQDWVRHRQRGSCRAASRNRLTSRHCRVRLLGWGFGSARLGSRARRSNLWFAGRQVAIHGCLARLPASLRFCPPLPSPLPTAIMPQHQSLAPTIDTRLNSSRTHSHRLSPRNEIAEAVTAANPRPVTLRLDKIYHPCVLQVRGHALARTRFLSCCFVSGSMLLMSSRAEQLKCHPLLCVAAALAAAGGLSLSRLGCQLVTWHATRPILGTQLHGFKPFS